MTNKNIKVPAFLLEEECELFESLTDLQKKTINNMREDRARVYFSKCIEESQEHTSDFLSEMTKMMETIDEGLSHKAEFKEKTFKCKYCGQAFETEEKKDKHQKLCL